MLKTKPIIQYDIEPAAGFTLGDGWNYSSVIKSNIQSFPETVWTEEKITSPNIYDPLITCVGNVIISVQLFSSPNSCNIKYIINHNGKKDIIYIDPSLYKSDCMVELGQFEFNGKGNEKVYVESDNSGCVIRLGSVQFDILNNSKSGGIWQTVYVTPGQQFKNRFFQNAIKNEFEDIENSIYKDSIQFCYENNYLDGITNKKFSPDSFITISTFAEWLYRMCKFTNNFIENDILTVSNAIDILYFSMKSTDWNRGFSSDDTNNYYFKINKSLNISKENKYNILKKNGIFENLEYDKVAYNQITRGQATRLLMRFYFAFISSGPPRNTKWALTFDEEFEGNNLNKDVWECQNSFPTHILSSRWSENVSVSDGALHLNTKKENRGGANWTTGSIFVKEHAFSQAYGFFEAKYKYTASAGINNAFWMITKNKPTKESFEIDVNEGHYPNIINTNLHSGVTGNTVQNSKKIIYDYDLSKEFHTYSIWWKKDEIIYYIDGIEIAKKDVKNAKLPLSPELSTAVLNWAGDCNYCGDGTSMDVQYVRVYKEI